jgi:hypothetical protein
MPSEIFRAFIAGSPVCVMFRAILERIMSPRKMDAIFAKAAVRQKERELLFSSCVDLMALVVAKVRKSVNAGYKARAEQFHVGVRSVYDKLAGIEPQVSERMVAATAAEMKAAMRPIKLRELTPLEGYDVRVLDGNYLSGTQHRLKELRELGAAALPGMALCVFDPQCGLIEDVIAHEDGHANERALVERVLPKVVPEQCWVADRNFCVFSFLFGVAARQAFFVVRHHQNVVGELLGKRKRVGRVAGGALYEQPLRVTRPDGDALVLRRITIELDEPTRFGERELHLLTNLPPRVTALRVAALYRDRWSIETAFMHLATVLRSELNTLAYPDAALFGFCIGLLLYNALAFLKTALRAAHPKQLHDRSVSLYYLGDEISGVYRGMMIAIPTSHWRKAFASQSDKSFAQQLLSIAKEVPISQFLTNLRPQRRPPPKRASGGRGNHVSTIRILQQRKLNC